MPSSLDKAPLRHDEGIAHEQYEPHHAGDGHDDEDLGAQEELYDDQETEHSAHEHGAASLTDEQLVQAGDDERHHQ